MRSVGPKAGCLVQRSVNSSCSNWGIDLMLCFSCNDGQMTTINSLTAILTTRRKRQACQICTSS